MPPFPEFRSLVATLRDGLASGADAETRAEPSTMSSGHDQDQLYSLVLQHHGRIRQQTLIEETGWSPTKVSELLQVMEEQRCIARIAVGREKIVVLPEDLPPDADAE